MFKLCDNRIVVTCNEKTRRLGRKLTDKAEIRDFWGAQACGEIYASGTTYAACFTAQREARYVLEPYIRGFARFDGHDKEVLEVGIGMGADHVEWARSRPRGLAGVDLTPRAVELTKARLDIEGLRSEVRVADAEALPYPDDSFDIVYSWGVLHHSPDTPRAFDEVFRVLRPGGEARIMVYYSRSITGCVLWLRYALGALRPWRSLAEIYAQHLESPGTKAYTVDDVRRMTRRFSSVSTRIELGVGDLMLGAAGQRHSGPLLTIARRVWPRWLIRRLLPQHGLLLLIEAVK